MDNEMTLGQWVLTLILTAIPCVGLVLLIVWAVSSQNSVKQKWAQAQLIIMAIVVVFWIVIYAICGAAIMAAFGNTYTLIF